MGSNHSRISPLSLSSPSLSPSSHSSSSDSHSSFFISFSYLLNSLKLSTTTLNITSSSSSTCSCCITSYQFKNVIGTGGFAIVKEMIRKKDSKKVAIKEIDLYKYVKNGKSISVLLLELNIMKECNNIPFVIHLNSAFYSNNKCYFVMNYLSGSDLRLTLKNITYFNEKQVIYYISCIGSALCHIHEKNIIHRDVKPDNITLDRYGRPYLTDFGISYFEKNSNILVTTSASGTLPYLSPEALTSSHYHSYQLDFWSLGITAYELLYKVRPYRNHCPKEIIQFVDHHYSPIWKNIQLQYKSESTSYEIFSPSATNLSNHATNLMTSITSNKIEEIEFENQNQNDEEIINQNLNSNLNNNNNNNNGNYYQNFASYSNPSSPINSSQNYIIPLPPDDIPSHKLSKPFNLIFPLLLDGNELSYDAECLICSLLDPRLHLRYGTMLTSCEFLRHPVFQKYQFTSIEKLQKLHSIFVPNIGLVASYLTRKYENLNEVCHVEEHLFGTNEQKLKHDQILPHDIIEKLADFSYLEDNIRNKDSNKNNSCQSNNFLNTTTNNNSNTNTNTNNNNNNNTIYTKNTSNINNINSCKCSTNIDNSYNNHISNPNCINSEKSFFNSNFENSNHLSNGNFIPDKSSTIVSPFGSVSCSSSIYRPERSIDKKSSRRLPFILNDI